METPVTLEDVRNEISGAVTGLDWNAILGGIVNRKPERGETAPAAQETGGLPAAFNSLERWAVDRGDRPLADGEMLRFAGDQVEVVPPSELASVAKSGTAVGEFVETLDSFRNFPGGSVLFGAVPAVAGSEIVDGFIDPETSSGDTNFVNTFVKATEGAVMTWALDRWVTKRASMFYAGTTLVAIASDVFPIERWIEDGVEWLTNKFGRSTEPAPAQISERARAGQGDLPIRIGNAGGNRILQSLNRVA